MVGQCQEDIRLDDADIMEHLASISTKNVNRKIEQEVKLEKEAKLKLLKK